MAERDDKQGFNPKHRIIGAIVLVALAVIFVPMILDDRPPPKSTQQINEIPTPDTKIVVTPVIPDIAAPNIAPAKPIPSISAQPEAPPPAPKPVIKPELEKPAAALVQKAPTPKAPAANASAKSGWVVQLGAFSNPDNAQRLQKKLKQHGYTAVLDNITLDKGRGVRVLVGPYVSNDEAKSIQARIQSQAGVKGVVLAYP